MQVLPKVGVILGTWGNHREHVLKPVETRKAPPELGERVKVEPSHETERWLKKVWGTVVYVNAPHRWYKVRFDGLPFGEAYKY